MGNYYGGAVLAYCIDVRLRRDHSSLEAVLKRARARSGGEVTNAMWEEEIALASAPAGALVVNARTEALDPVTTCFAEGGYVARQAVPGVKDSYVRALLGVTSVSLEPRHADVLVTGVNRGPLAPGDAIVEVGGVRVVSLAHLKEVLAAHPPEPLRVVVSRQGALKRFELPVPPVRPGDLERLARPVWLDPSQ
jgi:predicted metalloprotease with PDZ domain